MGNLAKQRLNQASSDTDIFGLFLNYIIIIFIQFLQHFLVTLIIIVKYKLLKNLNIIILSLLICELFILSNIQWAIPYKYYDSNGYNQLNKNPLQNLQILLTLKKFLRSERKYLF